MVQLYNCHKSVVRALFETRYTETKALDHLLAFTRLIIITKYTNERHSRNQKRLSETFDQNANMILVRPIYQISLPSIATPTHFLSILILNSQCMGIAIEGMDIWYMDLINSYRLFENLPYPLP